MLKKILIFIILVGLLIIGAAGYVYQRFEKALLEPLVISEPITVNVASGSSFYQLMRDFEQRGWINNVDLMRLYVRKNPQLVNIKAGEYRIESGASALDVIEQINRGEVVRHYVTVIEGMTFAQVLDMLAQDDRLVQTLQNMPLNDIMALLNMQEYQHPEGLLLADTFQFNRGASDLDILRRSHQALDSFLVSQWQQKEADLPYTNAYEALIMASIIEKETGVPHERAKIAGVFVRRLNRGMRLQTDPTVIYGMGERYVGRITRADLRQATPWNTYTIDGLPPTPIAMVGREAIIAALNPLDGDELYFVAKGDGTHHFSKTLREHNNAVNRYQRNRRSDYRSSPAIGVQP